MAVYPDSYTLEVGLQPHGSFRELLINEDYVAGVWPLSELSSTRARDISGYHRHGTYDAGIVRGVSVPLPEGALGCEFSNIGGIVVPHSDDLSLANGSMDIVFLLRTDHIDAVPATIVSKFDGTNGYVVELVSGIVQFILWSGGGLIFQIQRGQPDTSEIADDEWHLIHCCYEPEQSRVRIFVDGVQSGAEVTASTEPQVTSADFRIAGFRSGTNRYVGQLAYVMVGREGNPQLSVRLQEVRSWTSINADTRSAVEPIRWRKGIPGSRVLDNVATPGLLSFALDNSTANSAGLAGYYSPGHTNARSGWRSGIPVRYSITYNGVTKPKFRGHIVSIEPSPGQYLSRHVSVVCSDWIAMAASSPLGAIATQTNVRSDVATKLALDQMEGRSPAAVSISTGSSEFPYAFDQGRGDEDPILTELTRGTSSERGFLYPRGDGTVVWEGRGDRQVKTSVDATFDNSVHGLVIKYGLDHLVNIVRVVYTPRRVDASATTVLYRLHSGGQGQEIPPGETVVLEGGYRDPDEQAQHVGGTDMQTPVAGTDYDFWSDEDGMGVNLNASLAVVSELGGTSFRIELTNTGPQIGYLRLDDDTAFQLRGKGIYHYTPSIVERRNERSVRRNGPRRVQIDMGYESNRTVAEAYADFLLGLLSNQRPVPTSMTVVGNRSATLMAQVRDREPGDKVALIEAMTAITDDDPDFDTDLGYYIQEESGTFEGRGIVTVAWALAPSAPSGAGVFDESAFDEDLVFGV